MDFSTEVSIFLIYTAAMLLIYFFGKLLIVPAKVILKLLLNSFIGGIMVIIINHVGGLIGLILPINIITALISGFLGIPGILGLLIYFN